jgi:hypothetical protein
MGISVQDLAAMSEIFASIAVVVSLIYLAVQLKQNTTSLNVSTYQQWVALHGQIFSGLQDKELARIVRLGCEDSRNLEDDTYVPFMAWLRMYFYMQQSQYYLYVKGIVEESVWTGNLLDLSGVFRFPGVKQWWEAGGKTGFSPEFVKVVEGSERHSLMIYWDQETGFHPSPHHESDQS